MFKDYHGTAFTEQDFIDYPLEEVIDVPKFKILLVFRHKEDINDNILHLHFYGEKNEKLD